MITRFADILRALQEKEQTELAKQNVTHGPTIGDMYEGLTRELLDRAIPVGADLKVVDGFVIGPDGGLSPQIDCMLVKGKGEQIPHTDHYKWPVKDVIAVFEIKKNLYTAELHDSYLKLRAVLEAYSNWIESEPPEKAPNVRPAFQSFASLTGRYPRSYKEVRELPEGLEYIFHTLVMELLSPVRVVFGYEGFVHEHGLREGFIKYLEGHGVGRRGFGVGTLPTLIICGTNSIVKMNGQPYVTPMSPDGWWKVVASNSENPLRLMLELIWTRLSHVLDMAPPPDDSLQDEALHLLVSARVARRGADLGWEYNFASVSRERLQAAPLPATWEPVKVDINEVAFLNMLALKGLIESADPHFRTWAGEEGIDANALIDRLVEARIVARTGTAVRLIWPALYTGFTPDGQSWAATDSARFGLWTREYIKRHPRVQRTGTE
jgi:hypothetical protein